MPSPGSLPPPAARLDITAEICPMTLVRARLALDKIQAGEVIEIRLAGAEPLENIPRSLQRLGHEILSLEEDAGAGIHILLVRKG